MTFTSWQFGLFVAVVLTIYYLKVVRPYQVQLLVLSSLFFYGYGQPVFLLLLGAAVIGTYAILSLMLKRGTPWLAIGVAFNLALLAFFKYKFLFLEQPVNAPTGNHVVDFLLTLPLPIGISFFVFHNISLLVDLSKREQPTPALSEVFLYIAFFPQLVSGPITRAENFLPQIKPKFLVDVPVVDALRWIVSGYFFKTFVANNLNEMTSYMDFPVFQTVTAQDRLLLLVLYSFQIYADFFGYSAIAIGLALLFGYRLPINFDLPYISSSFAEFWTRWHISLSTWLRTYLYIPLGGNRRGPVRTYANLMIVMGLGGLWHGAAFSYLAWGLLHGAFLVLERPLLPLWRLLQAINGLAATSIVLRGMIVFAAVSLAWVFFKLPDIHHATEYLSGMIFGAPGEHTARIYRSLALLYSLPVIIQHFWPRQSTAARMDPFLYAAMAILAFVEAGPETSFIYFQF
jgi:alginate O-acetyltransferase complex protein AlgI